VTEHRERGATVFLSSHDLDEVERICDRVAIIRDGRLVAVEQVEEMRGRAYRDVSALRSPRRARGARRGRRRSASAAGQLSLRSA